MLKSRILADSASFLFQQWHPGQKDIQRELTTEITEITEGKKLNLRKTEGGTSLTKKGYMLTRAWGQVCS